jgi:hypothetical protein
MGLGSFPALSLASARQAAAAARELLARGEDPIEAQAIGHRRQGDEL